MTSEMAIEDIEQMKAEGLNPTVKDIVRLNALALKVQRATGKNVSDSLSTLPRVAFLNESIWFRQPTIGHEIWLDKVKRVIDSEDYQTIFAVHAYALSRDSDQLCDPYSKQEVEAEVQKFLPTLSRFTEDQVFAALNYAQNDLRVDADEYPVLKPSEDEDEDEVDDWDSCIALGTLFQAKSVLYGITAAEAKSMTRQHLHDVIQRAYRLNGIDIDKKGEYEIGCYYRTLDSIKDRLRKEKEAN